MLLRRRVYLTGALVAVFSVVIAAVGLVELVGLNGHASTFEARDKARALLSAAQVDVGQSQAALLRTVSGQSSTSEVSLPDVIAQQDRGLAKWKRYKTLTYAGGLPTAARRLDQDLMGLRAAIAPARPAAPRAKSAQRGPGPEQLKALTARAEQVQLDFNSVSSAEQAWWTAAIPRHHQHITRGIGWVSLTAGLALALIVSLMVVLAHAARRRDVELTQRDRELAKVATANEFEARLQRALELSTTEDRVFNVVEQALGETVPDLSVEVLLADSSRAHFQQLLAVGHDATRCCSVESPSNCPAAQRGEVLTFESSRALDACPYLKDQSLPSSALCVPVSVSGLTVGVVHASGTDNEPPEPGQRTALELVARRASDRIGLMRAFSKSETEATTDPLTGLPNRRSLENAVHRLTSVGTTYAVAFADLDHFKMINDRFGHSTGDQALRIFSRVLREGLRPLDLYGRYGGEEFVVVLPDCEVEDAVRILERISEQLAVTLLNSACPAFTVSFGLASGRAFAPFEDLVAIADTALLEAKQQGRNRVVVAPTNVHAAH